MISESYERLSHSERKLLARSAGKRIEDVPKAIIPFYRVMDLTKTDENGRTYKVDEEAYFAALCICCMFEDISGETIDPADFIARGRKSRDLGSLEGYDRRIAALMGNTEPVYFIAKLARLFDYAKELVSGAVPDCDILYDDIRRIYYDGKPVQRRWARKIYAEREKTNE